MKISYQYNFRLGVIVLIIFFMITSCLDDQYDFNRISDEIEINPGFAAPVAYGSLTIKDIFNEIDEEGYIKEFEDELLYIAYSEKLISFNSAEVIDIPNQTFLELYLDSEINIPPGFQVGETLSIVKQQNGEFIMPGNERIDSIFFKNTALRFTVNSSFKHTGKLTISSPNITSDGDTLAETIDITSLSGNFDHTVLVSLDGSKVILDNSNPGTTHLPLNFNLELINSGLGVSSGDKCDIIVSLVNIDFYSVYGFFGDYELLYDAGGIGIDLFDSGLGDGNIFFYDPSVQLEINNSYGIPVSIELFDVVARSKNNVTSPVVFTGVNPVTVNAPEIPGESVFTDIVIDKNFSNIDEAMEIQPVEVLFKVKAVTNPSGSGNMNNFMTDSSKIDVDFMVLLPIWVKAEGYSLIDTTEFDIEEQFGDATDLISYLRVTLNASNGLPMEVDLQVSFVDENYDVIDKMFIDNKAFLEPATLDTNDKVIGGKEVTHSIEFTESRLDAIRDTKYTIIEAFVSTAKADENKFVKFFSDYKIDFSLKIKADFKLNSRNL